MYSLPRSLLDNLINLSARELGIPEYYVEKDIHVTETIRHAVYQSKLEAGGLTVFQGGTSLAKAGLLRRFSEDIDVILVPPDNQTFGRNRKRRMRKEVTDHLQTNTDLKVNEYRPGRAYTSVTLEYESVYTSDRYAIGEAAIGEVKVEYTFREQLPGYQQYQRITSCIGDVAAETYPELLNEYPVLRPFSVLMGAPIIVIVDKLDAMHWRSEAEDIEGIQRRPRDVYDLAMLLSNPKVRSTINSEEVAAIHSTVASGLSSVTQQRKRARPAGGFARSRAFQAGHPACEALRAAYPKVRQFVYSNNDWIDFDEALDIIKGNADIL